jgi:cold shock protein
MGAQHDQIGIGSASGRQKSHLHRGRRRKAANAVLEEILTALARRDRVEFRSFGLFAVKVRPARPGRNPKTGDPVSVPETAHAAFRTAKEMRRRLNSTLTPKGCYDICCVKISVVAGLIPIGTVKWFNTTKGYGFIQPQGGGKDVFVHISAVERARLSTLNEGQTVEYQEASNRGKTSAENLGFSAELVSPGASRRL